MEENIKSMETLLDGAIEYGKTSFELASLKAIHQVSDAVSTFIPHSLFVGILAAAFLILNLGLALWLGEIMGKVYYGFFILAAFHGVIGVGLHLFMHKWLKKRVSNYILKQIFK